MAKPMPNATDKSALDDVLYVILSSTTPRG